MALAGIRCALGLPTTAAGMASHAHDPCRAALHGADPKRSTGTAVVRAPPV